MRKRFLLFGLPMLILASLLLLMPNTASAELTAGVQVGYGNTSHSKVLGEEGLKNTEWSSGLWANYDHEDLLFTGFYQGSLGLGVNIGRHLAQVGANYRFFQEESLQVYGGLGYQFISTRFETGEINAGKPFTLTGHGFVGQLVVDIAISEQVHTRTTVIGNPWLRWSYNEGGVTNSNIDPGPSFAYKVDLAYKFSSDFDLHLALLGGSYKAAGGETRGSAASVNVGVIRRF